MPVEIKSKRSYYYDLMNIENSLTSRADAWLSNTFINESVQLIVNSINLFEMGYFDCAYYSLRQSLELSTMMIYLVDIDQSKREIELRKWKNEERFPMQTQMVNFLSKNGSIFRDLKFKLSSYFIRLDSAKMKLNKFVHKQGLDKFYVSRNHPMNSGKSRGEFVNEFEDHLKTCIGAVAVFRLGIDPFPVLLRDDEIFHRTGDLLTEPYSDEFVDLYIGHDTIEKYKETEIYQGHYEYYMTKGKMNESVTRIVKNQYVDIGKIDEILNQKDLISDMDLVVVLICKSSEKVAKVYTMGGLMQYFTSRNTVRSKMSWDGRDFGRFEKYDPSLNIPYDEAFITHVVLNEQDYFIEHNEPLSNEEFEKIKTIA